MATPKTLKAVSIMWYSAIGMGSGASVGTGWNSGRTFDELFSETLDAYGQSLVDGLWNVPSPFVRTTFVDGGRRIRVPVQAQLNETGFDRRRALREAQMTGMRQSLAATALRSSSNVARMVAAAIPQQAEQRPRQGLAAALGNLLPSIFGRSRRS